MRYTKRMKAQMHLYRKLREIAVEVAKGVPFSPDQLYDYLVGLSNDYPLEQLQSVLRVAIQHAQTFGGPLPDYTFVKKTIPRMSTAKEVRADL